MKEIYSIWGIPSQPLYGCAKEMINTLVSKNDAPTFFPHITLVGDSSLPKNQLVDAIELSSCVSEAPFEIGDIGYSESYYKAVFANIKAASAIRGLRNSLLTFLLLENGEYNPHMSLLYGTYAISALLQIAENVKLPIASGRVARLDLVLITPDPREWEAVFSVPVAPKA
jgi:2'-5' RNA ligase